ncbi:hypothetical protein QYE76_023411 [Lolium multiflorum]|uniref:Uncharacterized protein n=1 Tax=Lolium multiflorum TaxID=4521 RepID=A0AAD8REE7_LOLMU|nr:hypothetical protein QYE76_023411 [Lolium multiflorum]
MAEHWRARRRPPPAAAACRCRPPPPAAVARSCPPPPPAADLLPPPLLRAALPGQTPFILCPVRLSHPAPTAATSGFLLCVPPSATVRSDHHGLPTAHRDKARRSRKFYRQMNYRHTECWKMN